MRRTAAVDCRRDSNGNDGPSSTRKCIRNIDELIHQYENRYQSQSPASLSSSAARKGVGVDGDDRIQVYLNNRPWASTNYYHNVDGVASLSSLTDSEFCSDTDAPPPPPPTPQIAQPKMLIAAHASAPRNTRTRVIGTEQQVIYNLTMIGRFLDMLQRLPLPRMSLTTTGICFLIAIFITPKTCAQNVLFPTFRLTFGTLYPAYASYKAVRTKNVKEYVKWMMYWIVYAFFNCTETFTDIFLSWFPFYYEVKVIIVLWLLSPATKGSSTLYRKFVHPMLTRREQEIDEYLNQAKERGYSAVLQLGSKGVNYATNVIMQTALKGGGNLVQTIRRSYSLSDLSEPDVHRTQDEIDEVTRPQQRILRPRNPVARSASGTRHSTGMYFSEVDVASKSPADFTSYNIRSSEDISSGYSSAEQMSGGLSRTSSMTNANRARFKAKKVEECFIREIPENMTEYRFFESLPSMSQELVHETYNNWRDQVYFENEQYFRNQMYNLKDKDTSSTASTYKDENIELPLVLDSPEMNLKYDLFKKWLEESKTSQASDTIESGELSESEDEFLDPLPVDKADNGKENETKDKNKHSNEDLKIKDDDIQNLADEKDDVKKKEDKKAAIRPKALRESLEEIQNNFRSAIEAPIRTDDEPLPQKTDAIIKRITSHCKGKAPSPPKLKKSTSIPEFSNSRSVSPFVEKSSKKGGLFKSYFPSIFRSESKEKVTVASPTITATANASTTNTTTTVEIPAPISEQYHLETEI